MSSLAKRTYNPEQYKVALVGGGHIGNVHARHWHAVPGVELAAVVDPRGEAVRVAGNPPVFTDWAAMLACVRPDIVDIAVPTALHCDYIRRAAAEGMAVFCEKPLARTMNDCDAIVAAVESAGTPFMAGHVARWFPAYAAAQRLVASGGVGAPATIHASRTGAYPGAGRPDNWYADHDQSGGVILDLMLHDLDWMRWCVGDVDRVFAKGLCAKPEYRGRLDYALVTLRFKSGAVGHATGSWSHPPGLRMTFEIAGDAGLVDHDSARTVPLTVALRTETGAMGGAAPKSPMAAENDPYFLELSAFVEALRTGGKPPVSVHDAREAVRIALAAIESAETGKVVSLA
jgi:UDP-N-acetylglucosamine 3-dehydrogenase